MLHFKKVKNNKYLSIDLNIKVRKWLKKVNYPKPYRPAHLFKSVATVVIELFEFKVISYR